MSNQDMRREVVLREINQGALSGIEVDITEQAADLVVSALDRYDSHVLHQVVGELILATVAAERCIPDGKHRTGCVVYDGAQVRERLHRAVEATQDLVGPLGDAGMLSTRRSYP